MGEFLARADFEENTRKAYDRELRRFLAFTDLAWHEIKPYHLNKQYMEYLRDWRTKRDKPLSKSSINSAIACLKSFFSWARLAYPETFSTNPTIGLKFEKIGIPDAQSLTSEQMERLWVAVGTMSERDIAIAHLLSHGLRASEAVGLNVRSLVDFEIDGNVHKIIFIADTKTDEPRLVPLLPEAWEAIEAYLTTREDDDPDRPLMLSSRTGERLSYHGFYYVVEKIGELAELPNLHPHQLRHTYATKLVLDGIDPIHAKRLTGIKSEQVFRRYTRRGEQEAAIAAFYRAAKTDSTD